VGVERRGAAPSAHVRGAMWPPGTDTRCAAHPQPAWPRAGQAGSANNARAPGCARPACLHCSAPAARGGAQYPQARGANGAGARHAKGAAPSAHRCSRPPQARRRRPPASALSSARTHTTRAHHAALSPAGRPAAFGRGPAGVAGRWRACPRPRARNGPANKPSIVSLCAVIQASGLYGAPPTPRSPARFGGVCGDTGSLGTSQEHI
jgi:hypothetical protein